MSTWLITGISRGFGLALAEALLARGHAVIGTTRNGLAPLHHSRLTVFKLDVRDAEKVAEVIEEALVSAGSIDVVVNNAGYGLVGAVEEVAPQEAADVIATNLFGTHNVIRAALPALRAQGAGHIVNFSSVGGFTGTPGFGLYNASKFAVEGLSEALAHEVGPLGIGVTIVEPGYFRTEFLSSGSAVEAALTITDYSATAGVTRRNVALRDGQQPGDPAKAAQVIIDAVESAAPPLRLPLGADSIARIEAKLAQTGEEIAVWRDRASATAFAS